MKAYYYKNVILELNALNLKKLFIKKNLCSHFFFQKFHHEKSILDIFKMSIFENQGFFQLEKSDFRA